MGGFHTGDGAPGDQDPANVTGSELLLRWIQFGALSPIMRTHCNHCERRIWMYPSHYAEMRDAYVFREALLPYIYTEARKSYDTAVGFIHPMYYDWPGLEEAYNYTDVSAPRCCLLP